MPETTESTRRWNGYVCPDCRFVFRVARDHDGSGLVCPGCRRLLRLPAADEKLPPLVVPLPSSQDPATRRRKRRRSKHRDSQNWEREKSGGSSQHQDARQMRWLLIGGTVVLLLCVAAVTRAMLGASDQAATTAAAPAASTGGDEDLPAAATISDAAFLASAKPLAERFLTAATVDELLPLVRDPARAESRIRAHYGGEAVAAEGLDAFNTRFSVVREGPFLAVNVRTRTYHEKTMAFVDTADGLKIDWESWVGWSAMPWLDFMDARPATASLFRVVLRPVEYYNFGFSDDIKWRSYRLDSPDGEHSLYGYVERGTLTDSQIQLPPEVRMSSYSLYLRFPEDGSSRNQVIIERLAADTWLIENEDPGP